MLLRRRAAFALFAAFGAPAAAQDFDPATLDLAGLIECRADVKAYNRFAFWLTGEENDALRKLGWTEMDSGNPLLGQFKLPKQVSVFGYETASPDKFLGEKAIVEESGQEAGITLKTRIALNVSTVGSHPGQTLAGCSYQIEVQ